MSDFDYDLFTIGAGSGGVRASRMAAQYGARVAVAEEYRPGGTCVIRGCVPKKLFTYASHFSEEFEDAVNFGWTVGETRFDWKTLVASKDKEIGRLSRIYQRNLRNSGAELIESRALVKGPNTVYLEAEDREVTAKYILIATGAWPALPGGVIGVEHAVTSNEIFHLEELPERIVIVGGGYIAVEFAGIMNGLGVDTTMLYRGAQPLRGFDLDIRTTLCREMEEKGIRVETEMDVKSIEKTNGGLLVVARNEAEFEADLVLYATGRHPNTKGLGLESAGVKLDAVGAVIVDDHSRSSCESIYAIGDVTNRMNLTPVAIREGMALAETLFNDNPSAVDYRNVPTAVFSQPAVGTVGLGELEAREHYGDAVDIYKAYFRGLKHTVTGRQEHMLMKLVVHQNTDRVLGVHLIGPEAPELIQLAAVAVNMGATKKQFDDTVAVHPSAAEEMVTMREKYVPQEMEVTHGAPRAAP